LKGLHTACVAANLVPYVVTLSAACMQSCTQPVLYAANLASPDSWSQAADTKSWCRYQKSW